ncbi:MAG: hypothetical protein HQ522_05960 [Bacteroidetes bacterium]|nr:hypothetical protein [Bacteroidota bacterium]
MTQEELLEKEEMVRKCGLLQFRKYNHFLRESLQNNRIIFGEAKNFNDPFDCNLPINISNTEREILDFLMKTNEEGNYGKSMSEIRNLASYYLKREMNLQSNYVMR